MTLARKFRLGALGLILALVAALFWLVGTESGLRFVFAKAEPYLPAGLQVSTPTGSLASGVCAASITWDSEAVVATLRDTCIDVEVARLLDRHLLVRSLDVGAASVELQESSPTEASTGLPEFESPLRISVRASEVRNLSVHRGADTRELDAVRLRGAMTGSKLDVSELVLRSAWLNADLGGGIRTAGSYPGRVSLDWQWLENPDVELAGSLQINGDLDGFEISHSLTAPQPVRTTGMVSYANAELLLDLANTWETIEWSFEDKLLRSSRGVLNVRGVPSLLAISLDATGQLDDLPEITTKLVGEFDTIAMTLSVAGGQAQMGSNRVDFKGNVGEQLVLDADFNVAAINELLPEASGSLTGNVEVRGSTAKPAVRVQASGSAVAWQDYVAMKLALTANVTPAQDVSAEIAVDGLTLRDSEFERARAVLTGNVEEHSLQLELVGDGIHLDSGLVGRFGVEGWAGSICSLNIDSDIAGSWSAPDSATVSVLQDAVSLSRLCLVRAGEEMNACVAGAVRNDGSAEIEAAVRSVPLALLPHNLPPDVRPSGLVDVHLQGTIADQRMTGDASLVLQNARLDAAVDGEDLSVVLSEAAWRGAVEDNRLTSSLLAELEGDAGSIDLELGVADILDFSSALRGQGRVAIDDLSLIAIFVPDISNLQGVIGGDLVISGTLSDPEFRGSIALQDTSFGVRPAGISVTALNARLTQTAAGRLQFEGSANSGNGHVRIQGETWVGAETGIRSEVRLSGQNFELARLPDWRLAASPAIKVVFDDRAAVVTGELLIPTASITIKEIPETAASPSPDAVVHEAQGTEPEVHRRIDVDVVTRLGEEVSFAGFGLTTDIEGEVRLRGGTHAPYTGAGRLTLREGRYRAYGQDLEIERGQLIFNGPLDDPQLDVRAVRRTSDVVAGILLTGRPSQLRSSVFSEPALSEADALSYLLTGRPLSSASSSGDGDTLNAAAFALGVSGAGNIVSQVRTGLGLETLAVEGGSEDGRLIAGKRFGDRLLVEYGYGLIDKLGTLLLRYQLTDRIILESRTGETSNFDILYSVKKK